MKLTHIDIHSHLNLSPLYDRREEILERMREDGIGTITVGTGLQTSQRAVEIAEQNPGLCWATVGVHPCDIPTQTLPKGEGFAPGYLTGNDNKIESLLKKAKEMRKSPTQTEEIIWEILRDEKLGFQFRRQHIIDHFIIDFVCLKKGLIIEIDGDIHDLQKERDIERDNRLKELGFSILRFSNDNILSDIDMVISKIKETIKFSSQVSPLLWGGVRGEDLNLGGAFDDEWSQICRLATHPSVVAIGETGLDYFHDDTPEMCDVQTEVFKKHIELAVSVNKPLMLHVRSSRGSDDVYYDALEILNEYAQSPSPAKGRVEVGFDDKTPSGLSATSPFAKGGNAQHIRANFHFFSGSRQCMQDIVAAGYTVSVDGPITFVAEYDEMIAACPLDKLVIETDAPYAAPKPYRGKTCEPWMVVHVAERIAEIKGLPLETVRLQLLQNSKEFFGIDFE